MQNHPYFANDKVIVLAHRGGTKPVENTIEAFQLALDAGADVIETDIQATKDGIAVLFHDESLERLIGLKKEISELNWFELSELKLPEGTKIPTLRQALTKFPQAKFNVDIKTQSAIPDLISTVEALRAHERVLVSSFSNRRRLLALSQLSQPVATSASASVVIKVWLYSLLGLPPSVLLKALKGIGALQIPRRMKFIKLDSPKFIKKILKTGTQLHYWTINDPQQILELASQGASGIVTDVPELAVQTLRKA
jgi:glycerophosphoryl diester phosphodiesterase